MGRSCKKTKKTTQTKEEKLKEMPSPKFKLEDQVVKKKLVSISLSLGSTSGTITKVIEKHNVRGRICYYYEVKWPDRRRSEHAQHILTPAP